MSYKCHFARGLSNPFIDIHILAGHIKLCLCLSILPGFLDSHPVAKKVIDKYGRDDARNYFAGIVSRSLSSRPHTLTSFDLPDQRSEG